MIKDLTKILLENQDLTYRDFSKKLIPSTQYEIIGVRAPIIKQMAADAVKNNDFGDYLDRLPHKYYEENFLHGMILAKAKISFEEAIEKLEKFLPFIDNWAVCDSTSAAMKIIKKHKAEIYPYLKKWLKSKSTYTVRFALVNLIDNFLDEDFDKEIFNDINKIDTEEYYINMAIAWYYSFALVKQYESTLPLIESKTLKKWIQNKSIQKAVESYRITDDKKEYLRNLKIK